MLFVLVFLYLAIKHVLAAHVWDVGYSRSRRRVERWWWFFHLNQLAVEFAVTLPLYAFLTPPDIWVLVSAMELMALTLGMLAERKATYSLMLLVHLASELCLVATYVIIAVLVVIYQPT